MQPIAYLRCESRMLFPENMVMEAVCGSISGPRIPGSGFSDSRCMASDTIWDWAVSGRFRSNLRVSLPTNGDGSRKLA